MGLKFDKISFLGRVTSY